ncbi:DUF1854 domain-containing protein [Variovorax paradoxus]|uniref:DUF1854 domain-containing protein n=1 Tax=Variovorax paradoxus TaxID=34073 RepID=A0A5Q0LZ34_VARPD|nr:DUF1854 domain-containing protein [Variovorax paradoxus]QFZ81545.1 DUF1854 domain-containing protein [Variovorax paradoxus]
MSNTNNFELARDTFGRLVLTDAQGERHVGVTPVRAFPLSAPNEGVSLVGSEGRELVWVDRVDQLPAPTQALLTEELAVRDFAPTLLKLHGVSSFGVPSTWTVSTDRGDTSFVLKAEEDIRRLDGGALLIASAHGVQFRIPDTKALDRASRKLLERFL